MKTYVVFGSAPKYYIPVAEEAKYPHGLLSFADLVEREHGPF